MREVEYPLLPRPSGSWVQWAETLVQVLTLWFQRQQSSGVPVGTPFPYLGENVPPGYLELNGQQVQIKAYKALYLVLGERYNLGTEDPGNFRLPDAEGRIFMQDDNLYGGADSVTLTLATLPEVSIAVTDPGHAHGVANVLAASSTVSVGAGAVSVTTGTNVSPTTSTVSTGITAKLDGGGNPISLKQKYFGGKWMVKT